jgi:hypothetical protein
LLLKVTAKFKNIYISQGLIPYTLKRLQRFISVTALVPD